MAKAGFNLDAFIGANADYARGYTFYINVGSTWVDNEQQRFLVRSSTLPASTITPAEVNWQGNVYKMGATQEFAEFNVSYSVDVNDRIRKDYEEWIKYIHDPENNTHGDPAQYMVDIELEHISHATGDLIMKYKLIKAFPTSVTELALDYASKETATFDVSFTYQYHLTE
jgi:hypothetical protein